MTKQDAAEWQKSGLSQAAWLWSHGQRLLLQNSAAISGTVFAAVIANRALGKMAEAATRALFEANGYEVQGQVTFEMASGTRAVPDFVVKDQSGNFAIVEVKVGNATPTSNQAELFYELANGSDVAPVGENAAAIGLEPGIPINIPYGIDHWEGP